MAYPVCLRVCFEKENINYYSFTNIIFLIYLFEKNYEKNIYFFTHKSNEIY